MSDARILVVEDDATARMLLADGLQQAGYHVTQAPHGEAALALLAQEPFDVVITDIQMRRVDGLQVLQAAKRQPSQPAVILLTGYGSLETSIAALRAGAHDYLLKPCDPPELLQVVVDALERRRLARRHADAVQTIARGLAQLYDESAAPPPPPPAADAPAGRYLQVGDLRIDSFRRTVTLGGNAVPLTTIEYTLLCCLAEEPGRALSYAEIARRTHAPNVDDMEAQQLLKTHIRNLRQKLPPDCIENVRGFGYMLVPPGSSAPHGG